MIIELTVIILMILLSAIFSSTETAFSSLNHIEVHKRAEKERIFARMVKILHNPQRFLSTVLVGNNIANIVAASLTTTLVIHNWGDHAVPISTIALTSAILLFAEIIPKSIATVIPLPLARFFLPIIFLVEMLLWPVIAIFTVLARLLLKLMRIPARRPIWVPSVAEIKHLVDRSEEGGSLDADQGAMIDAMLELDDVPARTMMIPRPSVVRIDLDWEEGQVEALLFHSNFTRIPVFEDSPDNIVGVLYAKDYLYWSVHTSRMGRWQSQVRPFHFFLDETPVLDVLQRMRMNREHMVGIVDEYGGFEGILTLEDILEDILYPEKIAAGLPIAWRLDGSCEMTGGLPLRDVVRAVGIDTNEDEVETIGGWAGLLGARYTNDAVIDPTGNWQLLILDGDEQGVHRVAIKPWDPQSDEDE